MTTLIREWAPNTNYTSGPDIGTETKLDPGTGISAEGLVPGEPLPAQHFNFILNAITQRLARQETGTVFEIDEDFAGAIFDAGQSRLDASFPWRTNHTGLVSINHLAGTSKHPGLLACDIPGDGVGDQYFEFHMGSSTGTPCAYTTFDRLLVAVHILEDPSNLNEQIRFGLCDDASLFNGGSDAIFIFRAKAVNAGNWLLQRRVGGVQTVTPIATFTNNLWAIWEMLKQPNGDIQIVLNGTVVHTVTLAQRPTGNCTLSLQAATSSADTEVLAVTWDLIKFRSLTGDRSGA